MPAMATLLHESESARIHRKLSHPVVDGDGHWLEPAPILMDYLRQAGGAKAVDGFVQWREDANRMYQMDWAERKRRRINRRLWWGAPASAIDRATAMTPRLLHERLGDFGVDYAIVYPTIGLRFTGFA